MKRLILNFFIMLTTLSATACQDGETTAPAANSAKTLIVYYSYTNNTEEIVADLRTIIEADVIEIEPAQKGLDYAANNYALGTEQLSKIKSNPDAESSYPAIDPVEVDMAKYSTIIIATPLWWSQMASNMQTFLFMHGKEMKDKNIGLIVSSHSSGISGVEQDTKRLVPEGRFMGRSLWINASNHPKRKALLETWLDDTRYDEVTAVSNVAAAAAKDGKLYSLEGRELAEAPAKGVYIENGIKKVKQ